MTATSLFEDLESCFMKIVTCIFRCLLPDFHISRTASVELAIKNNYLLNFAGEQKLEIVDALVFLIGSWEVNAL